MKIMQILYPIIALLLTPVALIAQNAESVEWESVLEMLLSSEELSTDELEELSVIYESVHASPLNINTATREELSELPFLSFEQIEDIHAYIYMHGPMESLGELQLTGSLDYNTRRILRQFVYAGPVPEKKEKIALSDVLRYGRSELIGSMDIPLYTRDGFKKHSIEELERYPNRAYLGSSLSHSLRYSFNWHNKIRFGLSAQKDAGEPFLHENSMGYDFWSLYFYYKGSGWLKELALGKFKAQFGHGLLMGSGFSMGKSISMSNMEKQTHGIKPHSSTQEYGYMQGVGATLGGSRTTVSLLGAITPIDCTLQDGVAIGSFKEDGYHRTSLEWSKKHNVTRSTLATNVNYSYRALQFGGTALIEHLSLPYRGKQSYYGLSTHLSLGRPHYGCATEIAIADNGYAFICSQTFRLPHSWHLSALFRMYSPDYMSFYSHALSEGTVSNETGLLLSYSHNSRNLKWSGYLDLFMHPEPKFSASEKSNGMDVRTEIDWRASRRDAIYGSLRFKSKQQDCKYTEQLEYCITTRLRMRWTHSFSRGAELKAQLLYTRYDFIAEPISNGWALTSSYSQGWSNNKFQLGISSALFTTDSFDSRISVYENGLRYAYNFATLYGKGLRMAMTIKYKILSNSNLNLKVGSIIYADREEIGSAQQRINSNHKEDISLQFISKF